MAFPAGPAELEAEWLESALRRDGNMPGARVRRISVERIGEAHGWDSTVARVTIDGDRIPATIVAKWCSPRNAHTELRVVREVVPRIGVATARVLGATIEPSSERSLLFLDDLGSVRQGDNLLPVHPRDDAAIADAMAAIHAPFWERGDDPSVVWLPRWGADAADIILRTDAAIEPFLAMWGERISPAARAA